MYFRFLQIMNSNQLHKKQHSTNELKTGYHIIIMTSGTDDDHNDDSDACFTFHQTESYPALRFLFP